VLRYGHWQGRFAADSDLSGIQKFHTVAVPCIGDLGILLDMLLALGLRYFENTEVGLFGFLLIASSSDYQLLYSSLRSGFYFPGSPYFRLNTSINAYASFGSNLA
jgi:hypothetical protein